MLVNVKSHGRAICRCVIFEHLLVVSLAVSQDATR